MVLEAVLGADPMNAASSATPGSPARSSPSPLRKVSHLPSSPSGQRGAFQRVKTFPLVNPSSMGTMSPAASRKPNVSGRRHRW